MSSSNLDMSSSNLVMTDSASPAPAPASKLSQSALVSFMKHGPQSLMDDEIKPREAPSGLHTSTKARIDEPDTKILSPALYRQDFRDKLKQLATLCVEADEVKQLLRNQVRRRQADGRHRAKVRFAREVLPIDLNMVVRELKEEKKIAAAVDAAVNSAMDVDSQVLSKKARKRRNCKAKKLAAPSTDTEMKNVVGKRKRSADTEMEDFTNPPASKKVKDALDLSDLARDLPTFSPAARLVPEITDKPLLDWYRSFPGA